MGPRTFEMEMLASLLGNLAWARLQDLMGEDLSRSEVEGEAISEAEILLQFMRAIASKSDFVLIRLRHDSEPAGAQ
jgi:hypothetical protein